MRLSGSATSVNSAPWAAPGPAFPRAGASPDWGDDWDGCGPYRHTGEPKKPGASFRSCCRWVDPPAATARAGVTRTQSPASKRTERNISDDRNRSPFAPDPPGAGGGVVNRTLDGSQPDWNLIGHPTAPEGAPNVLVVLIDDAGFGNPSTFGGPIQTPNYTRIAEGGVKYNRFHVTALCSPTRAALLTGRNSHFVGFGSVGEFAGGFPGYCATLPRDCAPLPRILRDNGYSTAAFGKWHLTPDGQQGPAGPLDRWPNGWGFDYFYGFLGGGASQWDPCLAENQKIIGTPEEYYDDREPVLLPRCDGRPEHRVVARGPRPGRAQAVLRLLLDRLQPRPAPRRRASGPTSTRGSSTRDGTSSARRPSPARRSSGSSRPTPSSPPATRPSRRGTTSPTS